MTAHRILGLVSLAFLGVGCGSGREPRAEAQACLVEALAAPSSLEDHPVLSCADPFGDHACRAAWRAAAGNRSEIAIESAIAVCRAPMCARVAGRDPLEDRVAPDRPRANWQLCLEPAVPSGFLGQMMWLEVWREALLRDLERPRAMALLGFWQGLSQPRGPLEPPTTVAPPP